MKFLHIADLHFDRSFHVDSRVSEKIGNASEVVLTRIVDIAIKEACEWVIFAGDTFHQSKPAIHAQMFFHSELSRLKERGISVILTFGNHDYVQKNRFWVDFSDVATVFAREEVQTIQLVCEDGSTVAISGFSYESPSILTSKIKEFPQRLPEATYHIGIYHGEVAGSGKYAPFLLSEMKQKGYDYWALGHIHTPLVLNEQMPTILYPGTPQGHTKKETDLKGVALVELTGRAVVVRYEQVASFSFENCWIELAENLSLQKISTKIIQACEVGKVLSLTIVVDGKISDDLKQAVETRELEEVILADYWISSVRLVEKNKEKTVLSLSYEAACEIVTTELIQSQKQDFAQSLSPNIRSLLREIEPERLLVALKEELNEEFEWGK